VFSQVPSFPDQSEFLDDAQARNLCDTTPPTNKTLLEFAIKARMRRDWQSIRPRKHQAERSNPLPGRLEPHQKVNRIPVESVRLLTVGVFACLLQTFFQAIDPVTQPKMNAACGIGIRQYHFVARIKYREP
jgi:hypothetical protein